MSHQFEDYREISNVRDKLDFIIELVRSAPRRVFLTQQGEVKAVVLSARDYEDLWRLDIERELKLCAEETETYSTEEVMKEMAEYVPAKPQDICEGNPRGWPAFVSD
jgi:PHD/YefM family antitoxin component YafN of YafNO toxin-antitoxin module